MNIGWKTILGALGFLALAVYSFAIGNYQEGITFLTSALALFGIVHKFKKVIDTQEK
jgi:uncharacterized membrane protein YiaA